MVKILETRLQAKKRAKKLGFPQSSVVKATTGKSKDGYFIAPRGLKKSASKRAYANLRSSGMSKERAAKIAWSVEN